MSQRIEIVAGDDVTGSNLQDIYSSVIQPGILTGFEMTVASPTTVAISPGAGVFDSGVFIFESEELETEALPISNTAQDFTVLYLYTPTNALGGAPATLVVQAGLVNPDTLVGGLVVGWIRHTGGSSLQAKDFISGRRIKLTQPQAKQKNNFLTTLAPLANKLSLVSGAAYAATEGWDNSYKSVITTFSNTTLLVQNSVYYFPLIVPSTGFGQIMLELEVPNTGNLIVSFMDTNYVEYTPSDLSWTFIAVPMARKILAVPQSLAIEAGKMAFIKLNMTLQPGGFIKYKLIGYSSYTEPF